MRYFILALFLILPLFCIGQIAGVSAQWSNYDSKNKLQFNTSISIPYALDVSYYNRGNVAWILSGGVDYLSGSSAVSGLNIKPISFAATHRKFFYKNRSSLVMFGADAGYNFNFNHGNDGIILTPYIYTDCILFYMKAGYDYNTFHNEGQFFIRLGAGLGWGVLKIFR